jgi:hypothetical protein
MTQMSQIFESWNYTNLREYVMIVFENIKIRYATLEDAEILCRWWNDGAVMAHAGFPDGLNTTEEKIRELISKETWFAASG